MFVKTLERIVSHHGHGHEQQVNETKKRSLLKAVTARIMEVIVDTLLFEFFFGLLGLEGMLHISLGIAISIEFLCFLTCYVNERAWNRIQWGRKIEIKKKRKKTKKN